GLRAPAPRRRRLAIADASAGTRLGLSRLSLFDPHREGRRGAADLGGSGAERPAGRDLPTRSCHLIVAELLLEQTHAASLLRRTTLGRTPHLFDAITYYSMVATVRSAIVA